ncbi:hypothetical protein A8M77_19005 [Variovorax sp. JS1663]|nr:hypothetical protein A8M77_19005 [Variovorax sp. JS1663]
MAVSVLTALVAVGTATLHLLVRVSHQVYLQSWGIDAGVFPKPTDWLLIYGYYGMVDRSVAVFNAVASNLGWLAVAMVVAALYLFVLFSPSGLGTGTVPKWLQHPPWRRRLAKYLVIGGLVGAAIPGALVLWTTLMVIPAALGETAGKAHAEREAAEFKKGCEHAKYTCVQLKKGGELLGLGFVLDGSPSHIAIYDVQVQRARVIPRDAVEMVSGRPLGETELVTP